MLLMLSHGSSRPGLKKNRRGCTTQQQRRLGRFFRAAFFFSILAVTLLWISCSPDSRQDREHAAEEKKQDALEVRARPASDGLGGIELLMRWNSLGDKLLSSDTGLNYRQQMVFRVVLRNEALFTGRLQYRKTLIAGYDPYTSLYYIEEVTKSSQKQARSIDELKRMLEEPVVLHIPAAELNELRSGTIQARVRAYLPHLGPGSVFARWLNMFFRSRYETRGETHFFL